MDLDVTPLTLQVCTGAVVVVVAASVVGVIDVDVVVDKVATGQVMSLKRYGPAGSTLS